MSVFQEEKSKSQIFGRKEGKKRKITWWWFFSVIITTIPLPPHTPQGQLVSSFFYFDPLCLQPSKHAVRIRCQGGGGGRGLSGRVLCKAEVESWVLALPACSHRHLPPPQAGGSHPRATGGVGCVCGVGMPPQKTKVSFLESTKVFNFFFLQDFSIFS